MKTQDFFNYEAPKVDVIEVEVEKGFAGSPQPLEDGGTWN
jgi:hypothetical protein